MNKVYEVGQVNFYIQQMFKQDFLLKQIYIKGEVSNCKYHTSGHIYFTLKDSKGAISCVMFAGQRRKGLAFSMKDGDKVIVGGSIEVYERDGRYQVYAKEISLEGAGLLYERFLALKKNLEEMGMFAKEYKQAIPKFVKRLGVVTAPTGAAIQDIRNISYRRNPYIEIILYPALVQGENAVQSIVKGIEVLDKSDVDVIIVGRGGGSLEDLWAFNEEEVARAIFACKTPVISAVGHETDTTIADYVADLRAPTPSAAAELAVTDIGHLLHEIQKYKEKIQSTMEFRLHFLRQKLQIKEQRLKSLSPKSQLRMKQQYLMDIENRLEKSMENHLTLSKHKMHLYIERLKGLSPLEKLSQGFSFVEDKEGRGVYSISQVSLEDKVNIQVTDGSIEAQVLDIKALDRSKYVK
ncbi:MAG TPA: exodeoxyribonuclease VII large subunit [Lachnospiraceae bacterium]